MKVKELIEILGGLDPEAKVVLSSDGEGNGFSPLSDHSGEYLYVPDSTWSGELYDPEDDEHLDCDFEDGDEDGDEHVKTCTPEPPEGAIPCIVLWPTN